MLQWYVTEQVEEEATFDQIVQQLGLASDNGAALLMIDRELAARSFTPPGAVPK
jgi:ferritin